MKISTSNCATAGWPLHVNVKEKTYAPSMPEASVTSKIEDIDSLCMRSIAEGDREAFRNLVERWQTRLINFFYRSTGNRADAEDLAQETFIELYRVAARYEARGTFNAFVFTLARRRLIDNYRKKSRRPLDYIDPTDFVMEQQADENDSTREIEEAFHKALAALPDNQRNAILMLQQQGLSYDEIAEALGASLSAVKTWIHRARTHLRNELKDFHQAD
ncbi:MAG: sigma-70 family RNA polymerase sigma factor [Verrucomicrobiota bacterium]